ncbi:MAG: sigma-70 family RNA polymerase sigma factor [Clostridia bacterium]|nr:sigma-70 family RNA polymerase sigma factor [Clostridia bacterium]
MQMDKAWFLDQIRDREAAMYALAMSYMKQEDDALDCMQQSILKAYEHLGSLRDPEKFRPWLYGILINCCKDELRRKKRAGVPEEQTDECPAPEAPVSTETKQVLWNAVDRLGEPYRTVLILFYYEDLPTADIAAATDTRPATVRKQLERARELLKAELEKEGFDETE